MDDWINQQVHKILGLSDKNVVSYIKACASKAKSLQ
jgi:hypothetical protein